jgi:hypothetical protein
MSICWFCHWGWARRVVDIYKAAVEKLNDSSDALHWGPSHIVWEDENFDDDDIDFSLKACDEWTDFDRFSKKEIEAVRESLLALKQVPIQFREPPKSYDGEHPEKFPPPEYYEATEVPR